MAKAKEKAERYNDENQQMGGPVEENKGVFLECGDGRSRLRKKGRKKE